MNQKRILSIIGLLVAIVGLVCLALCIFQDGNNQVLLISGLSCNSIAFVINCIANRKKRGMK